MDDNARKFIVDVISPEFLKECGAVSFDLMVDWLITEGDQEKKIARKKFDTGEVQMLLIEKTTDKGSRTANKKKITDIEYNELLNSSVTRMEKKRYEFDYIQRDSVYGLKYDEFTHSNLKILEVDASGESDRGNFKPKQFPFTLTEVTGDERYYGYRVCQML